MRLRFRHLLAAFFAASALLLPSVLMAQSARVFAVNFSNGRILSLDFRPPGTSTVINTDASARVGLTGAVVREDVTGAHLIVTDTQRGEVVFYPHPLSNVSGTVISSAVPLPDGPSLTSAGDIFLVNSGPGAAGTKTRQVWKIPRSGSGYGTAVLFDGAVDSEALEDTRVIGTASGEDLYVLSRTPARVLKYTNLSLPPTEFIGPNDFPAGAEPTGFARLPNGEWLIAVLDGTILRFDKNGNVPSGDDGVFVQGLGNGTLRVATGAQDDENKVFVSARDGGRVLRVRVDPVTGDGIADGSVSANLQHPVGIATTTSVTAQVAGGSNQTACLNQANLNFKNVTTSGVVSSVVSIAELADLGLTFPPGVAPLFDDVTIISLDSTAAFSGLVQVATLQGASEHPCPGDATEYATHSQMFHCADPEDPPIVEGLTCHNVFIGCGDDFGGASDLSKYILGLKEGSRTAVQIAGEQLTNLNQAQTTYLSNLITVKRVRSSLKKILDGVIRDYNLGRYTRAISGLESFLLTIDQNPNAFANTSRNASGELEARARRALAQLLCQTSGCPILSPPDCP